MNTFNLDVGEVSGFIGVNKQFFGLVNQVSSFAAAGLIYSFITFVVRRSEII